MLWRRRKGRNPLRYRVLGFLILGVLFFGALLPVWGDAFQEGMEYVKLRLYEEALERFQSVLSRSPRDTNVLFQMGHVHRLRDELGVAIETFERILAILEAEGGGDGSEAVRLYGVTHLALSEIYCKRSELARAEVHAKEAVRSCPSDADTHYRLGYIYTHQSRFGEARAAFAETLARNPGFAEVYEWLGLIALMEEKPAEAVGYYKKAIEKKPYVQSAYYNLAKAYRLLGDMESAAVQLKVFQQMKVYYDRTYAIEGALAVEPRNAALRLKLAEVHLEHKNVSAAIGTYTDLIRLNPGFVGGYDKLGRLYMNVKMLRRAVPLFEKVLELDPEAVEAYVRLGWLYTQLEMYDRAEVRLEAAIAKMPGLTLAYHGLGEVYRKRGAFEKAIAVYRRITELDPDDAEARQALEVLEGRK